MRMNQIERKKNRQKKEEVEREIGILSEEAKDEFRRYYTETINIDNLVQKIKNREIKNKQEDVECFVSQFKMKYI